MEKKDAECSLGQTTSLANGNAVELVAETIDPLVERRLKRKADFILIPVLGLAYLFNSLDRSNISNAQTAGLSKDLGLIDNQFNLVLTYYYIPFCLLGPPVGMLAKQISAKYAVPIMMLGFGSASLATAYVKTYGQLIAARCVIGIFEAGFLTT